MQTNKNQIIELNRHGDQRTMWCPENETETEFARGHFDALRKRGDLAFRVTRGVTEQITEFDKDAEEIVMVRQLVGG